ncbi:DNA-binding transcriptional regulator OxyR, partial [Xenorhabdus bovienii]|nr:DNA-binding transcriptional regulator OxyR [Xenorhabdus bovienii]
PKEGKRDGICYLECKEPEPQRSVILVYRPGSPLRGRYEQLAEAIRTKMGNYLDELGKISK